MRLIAQNGDESYLKYKIYVRTNRDMVDTEQNWEWKQKYLREKTLAGKVGKTIMKFMTIPTRRGTETKLNQS